jgi:hypothetical protein
MLAIRSTTDRTDTPDLVNLKTFPEPESLYTEWPLSSEISKFSNPCHPNTPRTILPATHLRVSIVNVLG